MTHHFVIFTCGHPDVRRLEQYLDSEGLDCTDLANMPIDFVHCMIPYYAWAVGGEDFILPPEAGFPIGSDDETKYILLQSHYDNPNMIENRIDSSGIRIYHTSQLRPNDAFTLITGAVMDYGLIIPPKLPHFQVTGHCDTECFRPVNNF